MIPISTFNVLMEIVFALAVYAWVDHRNKLYGNIAAEVVASITSALLAILIYLGAVESDTGVVIKDMPTAGVLLFVAVVTAVYSFFMILEAKEEYEAAQERL